MSIQLTDKDKKVILAFIDGKEMESGAMYTDGKTLDGLWMGGKGIAKWENREIILRDASSRSEQTVQSFLQKKALVNVQYENKSLTKSNLVKEGKVIKEGRTIKEAVDNDKEYAKQALDIFKRDFLPSFQAFKKSYNKMFEKLNKISESEDNSMGVPVFEGGADELDNCIEIIQDQIDEIGPELERILKA